MNIKSQKENKILKEKIAGSLTGFLLPFLTILLIITLLTNIISEAQPTRIIVTLTGLLSVVAAYVLYIKKRYYKACLILVAFLTADLLMAVYLNGGIDAPAFIAFLVPLTVVAWISTPGTTIVYGIFYILAGFVFIKLQELGYLPDINEISLTSRMVYLATYIVAIMGSNILGNRMLHTTLRENTEKQDLLNSMFASIDDAILILDKEYNVLHENSGAKALASLISGEGKSVPIPEIMFESQEVENQPLKEVLKNNRNTIAHIKLRTSGTKLKPWLLITASPLLEKSDASRVVLVIRNITEQVEQEYHLRMTQKMDAVGQLASGIAHDFNNMLGSIQGAAELLGTKAREDQKEMLSLILRATDKASKLTKELLLFTRKAPKKSSAINIHKIIDEVSFLLSRTLNKQITVEKNLLADNCLVIGDNTQIQSALMNMAINASHAMPEGGTLSLKTRIVTLDEIYCSQSTFDISPGNYIAIEVRDTGTGITDETMQHIFEPFFTTKEVGKGTGLGLSAVYGMVQKHKGAIDVKSIMGEGTVFNIYLPLVSSGIVEENGSIREESCDFGSGTILIVDDEQFIRITAAEMLKGLGYTIHTVENGEQALAFLETTSVDLVILDMIMPVMNGRETFNAMMEKGYTMPVIISSGFSEESDTAGLREKGLFGFINKPYQRMELSRVVSRAMS